MNKRLTRRPHLFRHFIKHRGKAAFASDFEAEFLPCCCLLDETGNKLFKRHLQLALSGQDSSTVQIELKKDMIVPRCFDLFVVLMFGRPLGLTPIESCYTTRGWSNLGLVDQHKTIKRLLLLLQRLKGKPEQPPLHTPEELECFKTDAIDNHRKHF